MTNKERCEWRNWWQFFSRRIREFLFLSAWATMVCLLNVYVIPHFPVSGVPRYMLLTFEGLFDIGTLIEVILLLFWPYRAPVIRWFNKSKGN